MTSRKITIRAVYRPILFCLSAMSVWLLFFTVFFYNPLTANAQATNSGYTLLAEIPTIVAKDADKGITLVDYMKGLFVAVIGLAIVLAVVQLVIGGIEYVAAALPSAKTDARNRILGAIGGLLLILVSWIALNALNPKLLNVGLNLEKVAVFGNDGGIDPLNPFQVCSITINKDGSCGSETCYSGTGATDEEKAKDCFNKEAEWQKTQKNCSEIKKGEVDQKCISKICANTAHKYPESCKINNACPDAKAVEERVKGGGKVCTGNEGTCSSCSTSKWDDLIKKYAAQFSVPENTIRAIIRIESSCNPNAQASDGGCGLMQITPCTSKDPDANIREGTKRLAKAISNAESYSYGNIVTLNELIYNAYNSGGKDNAQSADCKTSEGWPPMPKWACPLNPGEGKYNACFERARACTFDSCFSGL